MKLSDSQNALLEKLKTGLTISYFRGIGTKYKPSADVINSDLQKVETANVATVKKLKKLGLITEYKRESYHSYYKIN